MVPQARHIRVIVVDDDETQRRFVTARLEVDPRISIVGEGQNGREAMLLSNQLLADVIVMDISMPILDGIEAARRIHLVQPATSIILISATTSEDLLRRAFKAGAFDLISKDRILHDLVDLIVEADQSRDRNAVGRRMASTWVLASPKAYGGCTTLAVSLAADLASLKYRTLLVDLDLQNPDCLFYLGGNLPLAPPTPGARESEGDGILSRIRRVPLATRELHLDLLENPLAAGLLHAGASSHIASLMDTLIERYDFIVVDAGNVRHATEVHFTLLEYAERFFIASGGDLSSVRHTIKLVQLLDIVEFKRSRITLLLSPILRMKGVDVVEYLKKQIRGLDRILQIPPDPEACEASVKAAQPLVILRPDSPTSRFVRTLVEESLHQAPARGRSFDLWDNFRRAFSL